MRIGIIQRWNMKGKKTPVISGNSHSRCDGMNGYTVERLPIGCVPNKALNNGFVFVTTRCQ